MTPKTKAVLCTVVRVVGYPLAMLAGTALFIWTLDWAMLNYRDAFLEFSKFWNSKPVIYVLMGLMGIAALYAVPALLILVIKGIYQQCKEKHGVK